MHMLCFCTFIGVLILMPKYFIPSGFQANGTEPNEQRKENSLAGWLHIYSNLFDILKVR